MNVSKEQFLYAAAGYTLLNGALFTFAPEIPLADSFGTETAKTNKPLKTMAEVTGAFFGIVGTTSLCLAQGCEPARAVHCGLSVIPLRMAYDFFINETTPPPALVAGTLGLLGVGAIALNK